MTGREEGAELVVEEAAAAEPGGERPERPAEQLLGGGEAGRLDDDAAVEEEHAGELPAESALDVARHQLGRHRGTHVVADQEDRPPVAVAADQLGGQIGLPAEAVAVIARLVGEPEAEEVEREHVPVGQLVEQRPPVVGARWEPVQEQHQRPFAGAAEHVDAMTAEMVALATLLPASYPFGQGHRVNRIRIRSRRRPGCSLRAGASRPARGRPNSGCGRFARSAGSESRADGARGAGARRAGRARPRRSSSGP